MNETDPPTQGESFVDLPEQVADEFDVYINGVLQEYPDDYQLDGRTLVFRQALAPELRMTKFQFIRAALGIAGTYTKHDTIDIVYEHDGQRLVATGLKPRRSDDGA